MKHNIKYFLCSLLSVLAVFLNLSMFKSISKLDYSLFYNINVTVMGLCTLGLILLYRKVGSFKLDKIKCFLTVLFAVFMLVGESYVEAGTYFLIFKNIATIILSIVKIVGYTLLFRFMFYYLDKVIVQFKNRDVRIYNKKLKWYLEKFERYPFRTSLVTILLVWGIYLIAFYPIVLSPDPSYQIKMYFNVPTKYIDWVIQRDPNVFMTAHHPILLTYMLGFAIDIGRFLGSDNFGLFLFTLGQTLVYASVLAYTIKVAHINKVSNKIRLVLLGMYLFVPMYPFYTITAVKDTYYTAFMILYVLIIYDLVKNYKDKKISIKYMLYIFVVMLMMSLFRNNGLHIILVSFPFVVLYTRKNAWKLVSSFLLFYVGLYGFNNVLVPALGVSDGSIREVLSVPFQQTARYVKYHSDELSKEDIEVIDYILGYDDLVERYNPEKSDPVKNEFNKNTTNEDLGKYFKVWFKGLIRHPEIYIDATLNNIYGYFYPNSHKWYIYSEFDSRITEDNLVKYNYNGLDWLRGFLSGYGNIFPYLPFIGLLSSIGANTWALLILAAYLIANKKYRYLIVLTPLIGSVLVCVLSPVNTYFRYTMPYVFVLPIIIALLLGELRGVKNEKK